MLVFPTHNVCAFNREDDGYVMLLELWSGRRRTRGGGDEGDEGMPLSSVGIWELILSLRVLPQFATVDWQRLAHSKDQEKLSIFVHDVFEKREVWVSWIVCFDYNMPELFRNSWPLYEHMMCQWIYKILGQMSNTYQVVEISNTCQDSEWLRTYLHPQGPFALFHHSCSRWWGTSLMTVGPWSHPVCQWRSVSTPVREILSFCGLTQN